MSKRDKFVQNVISVIEKYHMISEGDRVIAGVSGGADSVCLLAVLRSYQEQCPFRLTVVHVEHGIRGRESLEDAAFVESLCRKWKVPCIVRHVNVKERSEQTGETMEEAARHLRYKAFETCCRELQGTRIAVAHNQNDQAETVLLNLSRGSGLRGLGGILPVRENIIRPLLFVSRKEIENWLEKQGISYCTDGTNLETDYTRNKIRLEILPKLEQGVNREAVGHMAAAAVHLQKAESYLLSLAEAKYVACVTEQEDGIKIGLSEFLKEEELMQEYILRMAIGRILKGRGLKDYSETHISEMKRLAVMDCGKRMDFPGGLQGVRRNGELLLTHKKNISEDEQEPVCLQITGNGIYELSGCRFYAEYLERPENMQIFPEKKYTKWLAYDTIKHNVCLRTRKTGDYLIVNQTGGRKKLKDYMIDQKIPREERDRILLVAEGSHILWVVGWRISEAAKVTEQNNKILKIQMMEDEI